MPHRFIDGPAPDVERVAYRLERFAREQERRRQLSQVALQNALVNGMVGCGFTIASFFGMTWELSALLRIMAILFLILSGFRWMEFVANRNASRLQPWELESVASRPARGLSPEHRKRGQTRLPPRPAGWG